MKKIIFCTSLIVSIILLVNIINILNNDIERLNQYGVGYLIGKIILFIVFVIFCFFTRKAIIKPI